MLKKILIASSAAALALPTVAIADQNEPDLVITGQPGVTIRQVVVPIDDLNLRSDTAVKIADARVRKAAKVACGYNIGEGLNPQTGYRQCYNEAFTNARVDLNDAIVEARTG
jgi:UrcA family protein